MLANEHLMVGLSAKCPALRFKLAGSRELYTKTWTYLLQSSFSFTMDVREEMIYSPYGIMSVI
jgi:hypothetical protein